ncbi:MAG: ATP-binding protein, partial [Candidatus Cloacimonadia bacterium]
MDKRLRIPTLNDNVLDFERMFKIRDVFSECYDNIRFDFSRCNFLRPNAVAFLGGLARFIESKGKSAIFDWETVQNDAVMMNLRQNGFAGQFGYDSKGWEGNSIPYCQHCSMEMDEIMDYLTDKWIGKGWVHVSEELADAIVGTMWEIYNNAFEHSETPIGVFSCGQFFKNKKELILDVIDFGKGIPKTIREYFLDCNNTEKVQFYQGKDYLEWAFQEGHTTTTEGVARGLGLDILKEFVQANHGKLEVYSNDSYVLIDKGGESFQNMCF